MLEKGEYPFQASHDCSVGKIMEKTYMLHIVCTGYCLWLFSLIAAPKLSRYLKSIWAIAPSKLVLFFFPWRHCEEIMVNKSFLRSKVIDNDPGFVHSPLGSDGDAQQDCSWVLMVMLSRTVHAWVLMVMLSRTVHGY